jgi:cytochrome c oxidase cbb3-type subunit 1
MSFVIVRRGVRGYDKCKRTQGGNMDKFVKNFIAMSMVYLFAASLLGLGMLASPKLMLLKFVHSHLMLLGWVSMMIYGVGYHILPRFAGKLIKTPGLCNLQFWLANIGLLGMLAFYTVAAYAGQNDVLMAGTVGFGIMEAVSIALFFYVMMVTVFGKEEAPDEAQ